MRLLIHARKKVVHVSNRGPWTKCPDIMHVAFSSAFPWKKSCVFSVTFFYSTGVQFKTITINMHCLRYWLATGWAPSHYMKQWWTGSLMDICIQIRNELKHLRIMKNLCIYVYITMAAKIRGNDRGCLGNFLNTRGCFTNNAQIARWLFPL